MGVDAQGTAHQGRLYRLGGLHVGRRHHHRGGNAPRYLLRVGRPGEYRHLGLRQLRGQHLAHAQITARLNALGYVYNDARVGHPLQPPRRFAHRARGYGHNRDVRPLGRRDIGGNRDPFRYLDPRQQLLLFSLGQDVGRLGLKGRPDGHLVALPMARASPQPPAPKTVTFAMCILLQARRHFFEVRGFSSPFNRRTIFA